MNKKKILIIISGVLVFVFFLFPVYFGCGVPGYSCTTAPDDNGSFSSSYDIEPLSVMLLETILKDDFFFKYYEGNSFGVI